MSLRITNSIMQNNTKANININKLNEDTLNTQVASGQKITRPSDDPVIAIRALRLNTNISEINQYYEKNIPDADAWMKITETALSQTDTVLAKIKESLTQGASDDNTAEDRMNILENLKGMRDQIYSAGNADYAGRTVFTGYRTSETLTFTDPETTKYSIKEEFGSGDVEKIRYISGDFEIDKTNPQGTVKEQDISESNVYRIRLSYDDLCNAAGQPSPLSLNITKADGTVETINVDVKVLAGDSTDDALYTGVGATGVNLITDTGELILGSDIRDLLQNCKSADIEYTKDDWKKNDLRPEHYFQCTENPDSATDAIDYNRTDADGNTLEHFTNQDIKYEISYSQTININTHASDVYTHDICRDVDELIAMTQSVVDAESKIDELTKMKDDPQYSDTQKSNIDDMLVAANKEFSLLSDKLQDMFSAAMTKFDGYMEKNNLALSHVGSMRSRLELTKERVSEQKSSFKTLADSNININLTDAAIDLKNAETALQAAQLAASKIAQQTLLNYL